MRAGLIDKTGKFVVKPQFCTLLSLSDGLAVAGDREKMGFIDRTGKIVIPKKYKEASSFASGLAAVQILP
jgi:hypothetical protein